MLDVVSTSGHDEFCVMAVLVTAIQCVRESVLSAWWESVPCEVTSYVAEGNCVAARRGGEQPEAKGQPAG